MNISKNGRCKVSRYSIHYFLNELNFFLAQRSIEALTKRFEHLEQLFKDHCEVKPKIQETKPNPKNELAKKHGAKKKESSYDLLKGYSKSKSKVIQIF